MKILYNNSEGIHFLCSDWSQTRGRGVRLLRKEGKGDGGPGFFKEGTVSVDLTF